MSTRLQTFTENGHTAVISYDKEWEEWQVTLDKNRKGTYHANDFEDAFLTAKTMLKNAK